MGNRGQSAHFIHKTMRRQLHRRFSGGEGEFAFDGFDWSKNVSALASFYCSVHRWPCSRSARLTLVTNTGLIPYAFWSSDTIWRSIACWQQSPCSLSVSVARLK